jgi:hypothetical protein
MHEYERRSKDPPELTFVETTSWQDVKQSWKDDEDSKSFKREYAEHGHESWESWRKVIFDTLHLDELDWVKYEVADPTLTIPKFHGGPFVPWHNLYYGNKYLPTFEEIVANEGTDVPSRDKFASIIESDKPIQLIGLQKDNEIYIVEGMHRSTSIALAASRNQDINVPVYLLLAQTNLQQFDMID